MNERAKRDFIEAYFDEARQRIAFLGELAHEGHDQEAMTLCLVYIDGFSQRLCWPSTRSGRNFVDTLVQFGGDPEFGLIHPLQAQRSFEAMKGPWKAIAKAVAFAYPGPAYELCRAAAFENTMAPHLTAPELAQVRAEIWRGTVASVAYHRLRNPSVHLFATAGSITFSATSCEGKPVNALTFERLHAALGRLAAEARRRSEANNQWFGDDRIVSL